MQNIILQVIQNLNEKRLEHEENGRQELAEKCLKISQALKEIYL